MRRIALYSHDAQGLGHIRRNLAIAEALAAAEPSSILLIAGAREIARFPLADGIDTLALPALGKDAGGGYQARSLGLGHDAILELRSEVLRAALVAFDPDVLVVDKLPSGVDGELTASLHALRGSRTRVVLGLREILDDRRTVHADWQRSGALRVMRRDYDAIWVYGDPEVFDPVAEYGLPADLAARVSYTGYVARRPDGDGAAWRAEHDLPDAPIVLCAVGGGEDGYRLAASFAAAAMPAGNVGVVVAGPFMPDAQRDALAALARDREDLRVLDFVSDADELVRHADRVVAMGGYNTCCEILGAGRPALVVPRVHPRREQLIRARRLAAIGALEVLEPHALSAEAISAWLAAPARTPRLGDAVDLGGLDRLPALAAELLAGADRGVGPVVLTPAQLRRRANPLTELPATA